MLKSGPISTAITFMYRSITSSYGYAKKACVKMDISIDPPASQQLDGTDLLHLPLTFESLSRSLASRYSRRI